MANVHVELAFARLIASNNVHEMEEYFGQGTVRDEVRPRPPRRCYTSTFSPVTDG